MGMVALSVSTSASSSPARTLSPSFLCHLTTVPSVMVSESWGMVIWTGIQTSREHGHLSTAAHATHMVAMSENLHVADFPDGGDDFFDAGLHGQLEIMVVGDGNIFAAHPADGGVEVVEDFFVNALHDACADAAIAPVFIDDDAAMGLADGFDDGLFVEGA